MGKRKERYYKLVSSTRFGRKSIRRTRYMANPNMRQLQQVAGPNGDQWFYVLYEHPNTATYTQGNGEQNIVESPSPAIQNEASVLVEHPNTATDTQDKAEKNTMESPSPAPATQNEARLPMPRWTEEQRAFAIDAYLKCNSFITARQQFAKHFNMSKLTDAPARSIMCKWVEDFRRHKSGKDSTKPVCIAKRTPENIKRVSQSLIDHPDLSVRKRAKSLGLNRTTVQTILKVDLKLPLQEIKRNYKKQRADKEKNTIEVPGGPTSLSGRVTKLTGSNQAVVTLMQEDSGEDDTSQTENQEVDATKSELFGEMVSSTLSRLPLSLHESAKVEIIAVLNKYIREFDSLQSNNLNTNDDANVEIHLESNDPLDEYANVDTIKIEYEGDSDEDDDPLV